MTNVFDRIEASVDQNPHGWCDGKKAVTLGAIVMALRPDVTVEIGVFGGRSAIPIALAHKEVGWGKLLAIDPWSAEASVEGYGEADSKWWSKLDHERIYNFFTRQVSLHSVEDYIQIIRAKSDDVPPPTSIGLLHIDGQHTDQAGRDVARFATHVIRGGIVVMDDISWSGGGVQRAVGRLEGMGFVKLYDLGTGAVYQRI